MLDTKLATTGPNHVPIILGTPFLDTTNSLINFRNGYIHITFGNMTLELNIFNTMEKPSLGREEDDLGDVYLIDTFVQDHVEDFMTRKLEEFYEHQQHLRRENLSTFLSLNPSTREGAGLA